MMRRLLIATNVVFAFGLMVCADTARADTLCGRTFESPEQLRSELSRLPQSRILVDNDTLAVLADRQGRVMWTFLKPSHPAAPGAACQIPVEYQGAPSFRMEARCAGPKQACDSFIIEEFRTKREESLKRLKEL
ncbi:hypothetical protein [Microvirga terricola]|uniref:Uncharacterized protein n=1 Tax=Microvirga terricola TaxID=2719797 RepID=A0ABX0V6V3_9HYPH|nr:hypothetical protein [Microvirga terricola]NIX75564.1 hypothetical protein [Microvirga terricola]